MFIRRRGFVRSDSWYIHVNGGDNFQMISFDLIDSLFKFWFWFEFFCSKAVVDTKRINIIFKGCDIWWIHGSGGDNFQMIIFDLINSLFKCWFWFEFFWFKAVVDTNRITIIVKGCDSWWISGSGGNTFQMIIFDLLNSILKCWIRFEYYCFKAVVHTQLINIIVKGCSNFSSKELWWKLDLYFIDHFSSFW